MEGKFISFEGGEGAGKTTQIHLLQYALNQKGISTCITREPGGTLGAEQIRLILKERHDTEWDGLCEALLLYAARRDHVIKVIKPALEQGKWVLCDRFADSTFAYQGYARGVDLNTLKELHHLVLGSFKPDLTFVLDVDPEIGLKRAQQRALENKEHTTDRFECMHLELHRKLRHGFLEIAKSSKHYHVVDGDRSSSHIAADILKIIESEL